MTGPGYELISVPLNPTRKYRVTGWHVSAERDMAANRHRVSIFLDVEDIAAERSQTTRLDCTIEPIDIIRAGSADALVSFLKDLFMARLCKAIPVLTLGQVAELSEDILDLLTSALETWHDPAL